MKISTFCISIAMMLLAAGCNDSDKYEYTQGKPIIDSGDNAPSDGEQEEIAPGEQGIVYQPSLNSKNYVPIDVKCKSSVTAPTEVKKTRILSRMIGFKASEANKYLANINKYGSSTLRAQQQATGRFYVKRIDDRLWIIDPEGYQHIHRGVCSVNPGDSERNKAAWSSKFGSTTAWLNSVQQDMSNMGLYGTGAFCSSSYSDIITFNNSNPDKPMTLTPSMGFLAAFKSAKGYSDPGNNVDNRVGLVFYDDWATWAASYAAAQLAPYKGRSDVLGFFSDNEINFSSLTSRILDRFRAITDNSNKAKIAANDFMTSKGATKVTDALNSEFAGIVAQKYYKAIYEATKATDDKMLYLGSRLHGTPKYLEGVIRAAGAWCDIISINYYSRWSVELTTAVADWARWAPERPFLVTEFYTMATSSGLGNKNGAGIIVPTELQRAYAYQHFTLGLLEAKNCVGWHWFRYLDDDANSSNKGLYSYDYTPYSTMHRYIKELNYSAYDLVDYFDK